MTDKKPAKNLSVHSRKIAVKGDLIIRQGEQPNNVAYLIQSGKVRVFAEHEGKTVDLAVLEPGQIFGEMALFGDEPRAASVEALQSTSLILITRPMIIEKLANTDPTIRALVPMLMNRLREANDAALKRGQSVAELIDTASAIYKNVGADLSAQQRASLEKMVLPKLHAFFEAIRDFQKLYEG